MSDFEKKIAAYKEWYVKEKGLSKYENIEKKVIKSSALQTAIHLTFTNNQSITAEDFHLISTQAMWFSGPSTGIMGQLVALEQWHKRCNRDFKYNSPLGLTITVDKILNSYQR